MVLGDGPKTWKNNCLLCDENEKNKNAWYPLKSDPGMNIGSHLPVGIITPTKLYLEQYTPDLENTITQFPI